MIILYPDTPTFLPDLINFLFLYPTACLEPWKGYTSAHQSAEQSFPGVDLEANQNSSSRAWELVNKLGDEELATEVLAGAHDALTVLFDRYHRLVFGIAYKIVRDAAEAEEVVQTVFLESFRALVNFDATKGTFKTWLSQFAYSRAINRRRHLNARRFYDLMSLDVVVADSLMPRSAERPEVVRLVEQLLVSLSPRRRAIIELTYFEGMTAKEIAARIGISAENVRHELYRGLAKLRKVIRQQGCVSLSKEDGEDGEEEEALTPDAQPL